jgi:hypothetical protein
MEIRRETDPHFLNRLSNDPAVLSSLPNIGGVVDWSPLFAHTPNGTIALSNGEDAAQVFEMTADRDWQVVTIFGPTCRGRKALETAYAIRDWIAPYADLVFGPVPDRLPQAKWFYRKLGGEPVAEVVSGGNVYTANPGDTMFACKVVH